MKYFSPSYWFKLWVLSAPLFNDKTQGINAKLIDNKKIKDWVSNNTSLESINEPNSFTNTSNYQSYSLNETTKNINPFYQTELETSTHKHRHEKSKIIKRDSTNRYIIYGDKYEFEYSYNDSYSNLDVPLVTNKELKSTFYYNRFFITEKLGYKTWKEFDSKYQHAGFEGEFLVEFQRNDKINDKIRKRFIPQPIKLKEILKDNHNVENVSSNINIQHTGSLNSDTQMGILSANRPFEGTFIRNGYSQKIFDESINKDATRINVEINMSLQGYIKNENLILQEIFKITPRNWLTTSGIVVKLKHINSLVLAGINLSRKRRDIFDINDLEEKNLTKWNSDFTKSINNEQHLPIDNKTNFVSNNITSL